MACGDGTAGGQHLAAFTAILCCCICFFGRWHLEKRSAPGRIKAQRRHDDFFFFQKIGRKLLALYGQGRRRKEGAGVQGVGEGGGRMCCSESRRLLCIRESLQLSSAVSVSLVSYQ